jgi:hypothetical protein
VIEGDGGTRLNAKTSTAFTLKDDCVERGVHVAYNRAAAERALRDVKDFLTKVFGLKS